MPPLEPQAVRHATPTTAAALRPAATVRAAGDDEQLVLLDLASGRYFSLNGVGLRVWRRLEEGASPEQAAQELATEFSMPLEVVQSDVADLVAYLAGQGLLVAAAAEPATAGARPAPTAPPAAPADQPRRRPSAALVAAAWLTLVDFDLALRLGTLGRLLGKLCPLPEDAPVEAAAVARVVVAVDRAAALYFKRAWCLQRSAACVRMLRHRGVPARLVLGVRPIPFYAHAWAELDGRVINDRDWVCDLAVLERF